QEKKAALELAEAKASSALKDAAAASAAEVQELKARLEASEVSQRMAVTEALALVEKQRDTLFRSLEQARAERKAAEELAAARLASELQKTASEKDAEIEKLRSQLSSVEVAKKLELTEALNGVEKERDELRNGLERVQLEKQLEVTSLKERFEVQLKDRDEAIERLRDMKAKLSTKMVGETLEQHCEYEFNRLRATAFPRAYFEKDNDARSGSKGDFIFRDTDAAGTEIVSIMFEMKNE